MIATALAAAVLAGALPAPLPKLVCPAGSERRGAAPPEGFEEWCEAKVPDTDARRREGPARVYYDDGKLWVEEVFRTGERDGPFVEWHRNGTKAREGRFARGAKDGAWTVWRDTGRVEEESHWRAGVPDGRFVAYWANGKPKTEGRHCAGIQCGRWSTYDEAGRLLGSVDYGEQKGGP